MLAGIGLTNNHDFTHCRSDSYKKFLFVAYLYRYLVDGCWSEIARPDYFLPNFR